MKTMLFSDFLSIRRSLLQSLLIALVVAVICTLAGGLPSAGAIVCAMIPITIVFSMQLYDDQNDWSGYRLTLPVNRRQVVWGRYLFMALCVIGAFLAGCAVVLICALFIGSGTVLQAPGGLSQSPAGSSLAFLDALIAGLIGTYLALMFVSMLLAITLPLLMRYGLTQAIRLIPVAGCIAFLLAMIWLGDSSGNLLSWLDGVIMDGSGLAGLIVITTLVCCGLYIASAALTAKLYAAREF